MRFNFLSRGQRCAANPVPDAPTGLAPSLDPRTVDAHTPGRGTDEAPAPAPQRTRAERIADALRRPIRSLRSRVAPVQVSVSCGPLGMSLTSAAPTSSARGRPPEGSLEAIIGKRGPGIGVTRRPAAAGASPSVMDKTSSPHSPACSPAVAFSAEIRRLFAAPATGPLTRALLALCASKATDRPDRHPLSHEHALLIATTLRSLTDDPAKAAVILEMLLREPPPPLSGVAVKPRAPTSRQPKPTTTAQSKGDDAPAFASADRPTLGLKRLTSEMRRALASTAGGFEALLHLQGVSLPPAQDRDRALAEQSVEHYRLALRAEDALIRLGLPVGGPRSTADIHAALDEHPQCRDLLDPTWLGTGNARRRRGGPHVAEHPMTLAAQAFVHAHANRERARGEPERAVDLKPAAVALRNGFTESGQGSDFHLMAKRLRKFIRYIDLACRTPLGQRPTVRDHLRAPVQLARRLAGKDKTPLRTLLESKPLASRLGLIPDHRGDPRAEAKAQAAAQEQARLDERLRQMQREFDGAEPARRREILRQIMNAVVTGNDVSTYRDGRRHGVGATVGYGVADIAGVGGASLGITPVVDVGVDHTRAAVFKAGPSSSTGLLFLGSERKLSGSAGVGVRAGAQFGPVGVTAQAMARLGGSHLVSRGLMIRTSREGQEHRQLPPEEAARLTATDWRAMGERVVNAVFEIADLPPEQRPAHGGAMWARMVERIGEHRDISFGWNEGRAKTAEVALSLDGFAAAGLGLGLNALATAGVGIKHSFLDQQRSRDTGGASRVEGAGEASRKAVGMGASIGVTHPTVPLPTGQHLALLGRHKVGVETELVLQANGASTRITTEHGKVRPRQSLKYREIGVRDDFIRAVDRLRADWAPRLGRRDADGRLQGGDQALDAFLQQVLDLPPAANRIYIEARCLTPQAGERINALMEQLAVLQRPLPPGVGIDPAERRRIETQIRALHRQLAERQLDESSWEPYALIVNETVPVERDFGLTGDGTVLPAAPHDPAAGRDGFTERFLGGGRVALGAHVNTALVGRDLLTLRAQPASA